MNRLVPSQNLGRRKRNRQLRGPIAKWTPNYHAIHSNSPSLSAFAFFLLQLPRPCSFLLSYDNNDRPISNETKGAGSGERAAGSRTSEAPWRLPSPEGGWIARNGMTRREAQQPSASGGIYVLAGAGAKSKKTWGLFRPEVVLLAVIALQSLAIIAVYESASRPQLDIGNVGALAGNATTAAIEEERPNNNSVDPSSLAFGVPNPGGLILSSCFSYMQDPREVHRKRPLPHILPTFENMYHFHATVVHHNLHAILFYDDASFNATFVKRCI
ncbi:hypothetical protein ACHAXT_000904 [Thalassiosira profunda]